MLRGDYGDLLSRLGERKAAVLDLLAHLETETDWLEAPASADHHCNYAGGLLEHSVSTARELLRLKELMHPDIQDESCLIVGLFHDVGKTGSPDCPAYFEVKQPDGSSRWIYNDDRVAMSHSVRSLQMVSRFIPLSEEESQAICYHDGQYVLGNRVVKNRETPLLLLTHFADMWSSHVLEPRPKPNAPKGDSP